MPLTIARLTPVLDFEIPLGHFQAESVHSKDEAGLRWRLSILPGQVEFEEEIGTTCYLPCVLLRPVTRWKLREKKAVKVFLEWLPGSKTAISIRSQGLSDLFVTKLHNPIRRSEPMDEKVWERTLAIVHGYVNEAPKVRARPWRYLWPGGEWDPSSRFVELWRFHPWSLLFPDNHVRNWSLLPDADHLTATEAALLLNWMAMGSDGTWPPGARRTKEWVPPRLDVDLFLTLSQALKDEPPEVRDRIAAFCALAANVSRFDDRHPWLREHLVEPEPKSKLDSADNDKTTGPVDGALPSRPLLKKWEGLLKTRANNWSDDYLTKRILPVIIPDFEAVIRRDFPNAVQELNPQQVDAWLICWLRQPHVEGLLQAVCGPHVNNFFMSDRNERWDFWTFLHERFRRFLRCEARDTRFTIFDVAGHRVRDMEKRGHTYFECMREVTLKELGYGPALKDTSFRILSEVPAVEPRGRPTYEVICGPLSGRVKRNDRVATKAITKKRTSGGTGPEKLEHVWVADGEGGQDLLGSGLRDGGELLLVDGEPRPLVVEAPDLPLEGADRPVATDALDLVEGAFERDVDSDEKLKVCVGEAFDEHSSGNGGMSGQRPDDLAFLRTLEFSGR